MEFKHPDYGWPINGSSILSRFWFPNVPLWLFAAGYAILTIIVVLTGNEGFDKVENLLAVIKTAAIVIFIILAAAAVFGWIHGDVKHAGFPNSVNELFPEGWKGFWSSLIYAFTLMEE